MDWTEHYPNFNQKKEKVEFLDVGCGYGGLLMELSSLFPEKLSLGLEIREKVFQYVQTKIRVLRKDNPGKYTNISVIRTNAMRTLPNFFEKAQLSKMFFLFPDPHFKRKKYKWRIISPQLLAEYAYLLKKGGIIYTITDVKKLYDWMHLHLSEHPLFEEIPEKDLIDDPVVNAVRFKTEEGKRVERLQGDKFLAVFRRI
ncbi:tRNA (guanine-n(7)-)-methyltransferase [Anaeramoeba ignava]|uniref:tRNA (guanine-N(7)-)-methyltransferase n=1 Tax=Anaeramoeba ignava TaxID=1746090 RepID=A0A9Q0LVN5_ANAIG|nr:tRNA (guanine-n(7)-)-methyltransferase [Anaeramoeba ignava]